MRKLFTIGRSQSAIFFTVFLVIVCTAVYVFVYIPSREHEMQAQHFRALERTDKNIIDKMTNLGNMLSNLLEPFVNNDNVKKSTNDSDLVKAFIPISNRKVAWKNFNLSKVKTYTAEDIKTKYPNSGDFLERGEKGEYHELVIDSSQKKFTITLIKKDSTDYKVIALTTNFDQFFSPLLPKDIFDQYIIFSDTDPIYESFTSGVTFNKNDTSVYSDKKIQSTVVKDLNIGGIDYKMFLQPVNFETKYHWVLAGLLTTQRYDEEKKALPSGLILLVGTIAIIIVVAFPWIKIFQMGKNNMLTLGDGASSIMVSILLMAFLFFFFFRYNGVWIHQDTDKEKASQIVLADTISKAFDDEIEKRYNDLVTVDAVVDSLIRAKSKKPFPNEITSKNFDDVFDSLNKKDALRKTIFTNPSFVKMFWIDSGARDRYYIIPTNDTEPHVFRFWQRDFFKNIMLNKPMYLNGEATKPVYVEQVMSKVDGVFRSVMAKRTTAPKLAVVAFGFNMMSMTNVVLPEGYSFAITDMAGKVLYCSDSTRNLNENLLDEFSESDNLRKAYISRSAVLFHTDYYDEKYKVYAEPLKGLPYYVVVLSDTDFKGTRDYNVYSFTISMLFFFFLLVSLQITFVIFLTDKKFRFPTRHFVSAWLWPKAGCQAAYNTVTIAHFLMIIMLILLFRHAGFIEYFLLLILAETASLFLVVMLSLGKQEASKGTPVNKVKIFAGFLFFLLVINGSAAGLLDNFYSFLWKEGAIVLLVSLTLVLNDRLNKILSGIKGWDHFHSYTLMNVTRLFLTSGLPLLLFYVTAFNYEQGMLTRYRQVNYADNLTKKYTAIESADAKDSSFLNPAKKNTTGFYVLPVKPGKSDRNQGSGAPLVFRSGVYTDGKWINHISLAGNIHTASYSKEDTATDRILNAFRLYHSPESVLESNMYLSKSSDNAYFFNRAMLSDAVNKKDAPAFYRKIKTEDSFLQITSHPDLYNFPGFSSPKEWVFWLLLVFTLCIFFLVMLTVTKRLFAYSFTPSSAAFFSSAVLNREHGLDRPVYIINLAGSNFLVEWYNRLKTGTLFAAVDKKQGEDAGTPASQNDESAAGIYEVDFMNLPDSKLANAKTFIWQKIVADCSENKPARVLIKNLDFNLYNPVSDYERVSFLESLMINNCQVIFYAAKDPDELLSRTRMDETGMSDVDKRKITEYRQRMQAIFKQCAILYYPVTQTAGYLQLSGTALDDFYQSVWNILSEAEKFILYDLAKDGLVNVHDEKSINMLIAKGIIACDENKKMYLFRADFKDFIIRTLGSKGFSLVQSHIDDNGNWNSLRVPLVVIISALLVLLFASQQSVYSKLIGYLGAFAAGVPTIMKLFSLFEKNDSKK